ncbi:ATP-binding protein [Candidatus Riflebacteria bacterium]
MKVKRCLNLVKLLKKKSIFLFGPRQTGKTTLIKDSLLNYCTYIDLLKSKYFLPLSNHPAKLESFIDFKKPFAVIDEIQKLPILLDEVHHLIEEKKIRFLLTGSSARKLKRGKANLLAGRAWPQYFHPLTYWELKEISLDKYLLYGGMPAVYLSREPDEELDAYVQVYLKEEIKEEGFVRNLQSFTRFLEVAALCNTELVNYSQIASDAEVPMNTVRDFFQILDDTLIGFFLHPYRKTKKRKAIATPKFYFFDLGVTHYLAGIKSLDPKGNLFGRAFEHFIVSQVKAYIDYQRIKKGLSFWRSRQKDEVDLIVGDDIAIEIKSTNKISEKHLKGLRRIQAEGIFKHYIVVSMDDSFKNSGKIKNYHWRQFLDELWAGNFIK